MKKLSAVTASVLVAGALSVAPAAGAATSTASHSLSASADNTTDPVSDGESAPAFSFYASAVGDMFKCGGSFGKLWCKN